MFKTEGPPTGLGANFGRSNGLKKPFAKVVDFDDFGRLFGPGAPDPDLVHSRIDVSVDDIDPALQNY